MRSVIMKAKQRSYKIATVRKTSIIAFCFKLLSQIVNVSKDLNIAPAVIFSQYLLYIIWCVWKKTQTLYVLLRTGFGCVCVCVCVWA